MSFFSVQNLLDRSRYWQCTNEEYHADTTHDSHSSLDLFRTSVAQYAARRILKSCSAPAPSDAMLFGSLFHTVVLEPDSLLTEYVVEEKNDRRTTAGKIAAAQFETLHAGKKLVSQFDMNRAWNMRKGIMANGMAAELIMSQGLSEVSFKVLDCKYNIPLKVRIDRLTKDGVIADLKSTEDVSPAAWSKTVHNFGYYRQAAMYLEAAAQLGIRGPFIFIAVSKTPPHESVCYQLDDAAIALGHAENDKIKKDLAKCRETGIWLSRYSNIVNKVGLPRYAYSVGR